MRTYFKTEADAAQNLIDDFFSNFGCQKNLPQEEFQVKKNMGVRGYFLKKTEALHAELKERVEAAASSCSAEVDFLQFIHSVLVAKNHQKIRLTCLVYELYELVIVNDINRGYRAAISKKSSLWLLSFYMAMATYCYYEKVRRTLRTAIVSYLLKH